MIFAYPLGEFTGKQPLCFCILQFILHVFSLFCPALFFSVHQAWLIVDFHQITTIIHRPAPRSRQPVKASPADRKEKSRFTHFRKSRLSPWQGTAVRYLPLFKPWAVHRYCWRRASGLLHGVLVWKKMWFWRKQSKAWIFFFFSYLVTQFPSSPFSSFFLLKKFSLNCSLYISALCSFCEI